MIFLNGNTRLFMIDLVRYATVGSANLTTGWLGAGDRENVEMSLELAVSKHLN